MSGRERNRTENNVVTLGARDSLVGVLKIDGDLLVHGTVEGEVSVSGDVTVEATATVQASIDARNVTIRGQVEGNVVSQKRLQLSGSGTLHGDAQVGRLIVEDGASFNGSISMNGGHLGSSDKSNSMWTETTDEADAASTEETAPEVEMVGAADGYGG